LCGTARPAAPLDAVNRAASYSCEYRARNDAHADVHPRYTHPLSGPCTVKGLLVVPHLSSQDLTRRPSTWNSYRHDYLIMGLKEDFELAAEAAKTLPDSVSNEDKLKLYGLFKQATVGDVNTGARLWLHMLHDYPPCGVVAEAT
jgi:Acyl CoA binding protein